MPTSSFPPRVEAWDRTLSPVLKATSKRTAEQAAFRSLGLDQVWAKDIRQTLADADHSPVTWFILAQPQHCLNWVRGGMRDCPPLPRCLLKRLRSGQRVQTPTLFWFPSPIVH